MNGYDYLKKYLKYKGKYISLKNQMKKESIGINNFFGGINTERTITCNKKNFNIDIPNLTEVQIDDYYFRIIGKFYLMERIAVLMISSTYPDFREYNKFIIYTSQSELNFRRLLYIKDTSNVHLYKGREDYVQQTLIDIRLQKFICESEKLNGKLECGVMMNYTNLNEMNVIDYEIKINIDNPKRRLNLYPFNTFTDSCGIIKSEIFRRSDEEIYDNLINNLRNYSNELESYFTIDKPKFLYDYRRELNNKENGTMCINFRISIFSVNLIVKEGKKKDTILIDNNDEFKFDDDEFGLDDNEKNKYILYFMIYDLCAFNYCSFYENSESDEENKLYGIENNKSYIKNKKCKYRNYFAPISICKKNSKITKYGLPENYVQTGNYTCKPIDYSQQCTNYENNLYMIGEPIINESESNPYTGYTFIGNRYNELFPFNIIKNEYSEIIQSHISQNYNLFKNDDDTNKMI